MIVRTGYVIGTHNEKLCPSGRGVYAHVGAICKHDETSGIVICPDELTEKVSVVFTTNEDLARRPSK
jgi:hypothetical protein